MGLTTPATLLVRATTPDPSTATTPDPPTAISPQTLTSSSPISAPPAPALIIDGSLHEGGGQIVRTAVALAAVLSRSVTVRNVRKSRSSPGLKPQHLAAVALVARIARAPLSDARPSSLSFTMHSPSADLPPPTPPLEALVSTAGATALVLQAALPPALCHLSDAAPALLTLGGGTSASLAPTSDYVVHVLAPNLRLFGLGLHYHLHRHGFFPRGRGLCSLRVDKSACPHAIAPTAATAAATPSACTLSACDLRARGAVLRIAGNVVACGRFDTSGVAARMVRAAVAVLRDYTRGAPVGYPRVSPADIAVEDLGAEECGGGCACITLYATTEGGAVLGASGLWTPPRGKRRGKRPRGGEEEEEAAEGCARAAAEELCAVFDTGAAVDAYMADQLCVYMAMAQGTSRIKVPEVTMHLKSVMEVCQAFGVKIKVDEDVLVCEGLGIPLLRE